MIRKNTPRRRGAAVVEMAVTLPVFILVLFGIIEFGRAMMVSQVLTNASRLGARRAIVEDVTNSEVQQVVKDFCQTAANVGSSDVTVAFGVATASGNNSSGGEFGNAQTGDMCTVTVSIPFSAVTYLAPPKFIPNVILSGTATMERE